MAQISPSGQMSGKKYLGCQLDQVQQPLPSDHGLDKHQVVKGWMPLRLGFGGDVTKMKERFIGIFARL